MGWWLRLSTSNDKIAKLTRQKIISFFFLLKSLFFHIGIWSCQSQPSIFKDLSGVHKVWKLFYFLKLVFYYSTLSYIPKMKEEREQNCSENTWENLPWFEIKTVTSGWESVTINSRSYVQDACYCGQIDFVRCTSTYSTKGTWGSSNSAPGWGVSLTI